MYTMYVYKMFVIVVLTDFVFLIEIFSVIFLLDKQMHYRNRMVVISINTTNEYINPYTSFVNCKSSDSDDSNLFYFDK